MDLLGKESWTYTWRERCSPNELLLIWVKECKPGFVANTVVPNFNIGEIVVYPSDSSNGSRAGIAEEGGHRAAIARTLLPQFMVSLVDDGLLHPAAPEQENIQNERILAAGPAFNFNNIPTVLNKLGYKPLPAFVPGDDATAGKTLDNSRSVELLKRYDKDGFDGLEVAIQRCLSSPAIPSTQGLLGHR